ncbi:MAG TPA: funZ protein [Bacteroidota bacterium]|nr:funZ protein [Bacteroidota bacterium]
MIPIPELQLGFRDAENYKRRENKDLLNRLFVRTPELEGLCEPSTFFLVGEKGSGKTAYAVYMENNQYREKQACLKYIRETEYAKFVELKQSYHLTLTDYTRIWRVILLLLFAERIAAREGRERSWWDNNRKFRALKQAIDAFYDSAFSPEIVNAMQFAIEADVSARLLSKHAEIGADRKNSVIFTENRFQINLMFVERQLESALTSVKLDHDYIIFVDGIDIRPGTIPYDTYLECIKGLANAVWAVNNDFFAAIKGSKGRMRAVLLVRPDIFDKLGLQNQNSKLRDNSVVLDWLTTYREHRSSGLFQIAERVLAFQQSPACREGEAWDHYFPFEETYPRDEREHPSSFIEILRISLYRPRDILSILAILKANFVAQGRDGYDTFKVADLRNPMFTRQYSDYLLGEVKDHLCFYYPADAWEHFLRFFQCLHGKPQFTHEEFENSYNEYALYFRRNGLQIPSYAKSPDTFLQFLYDLAVLCWVSETEDEKFYGYCFRERTPTNLAPKVRVGVAYKMHPGIKKALDIGKPFQ